MVDAVVGPIHDDLPERFQVRRLAEENLVLITPPGHYRISSLAACRDEPFVCLPPGSGLHSIVHAAAAEHGFIPRTPFQAGTPGGVRELVGAGLGIALIAESSARSPGPAIDVHQLTPAPPHPPIGAIRLRSRASTPAVRAWDEQLLQTYPGDWQ